VPEQPHAILFTGFEPSGDDHAAAVIAELKARQPDLPIYAWGGPKMQAAGATIVERTGDSAVMGLPGLAKIQEHREINARIKAWLVEHPVAVHVPVDSPAANFPICNIARASGARVVHLVAPQVWAWGKWRVKKLRRLTDHVCCLLPFEEPWFRQRHVPATFVGHPLFDHPLDTNRLDEIIADWPRAQTPGLNIALMPGSRPAEITKNFGLLIGVFNRLLRTHPDALGVVAATKAELEPQLRALAEEAGEPWPEQLRIEPSNTDATIRWSDFCLVVSGTVTLQIARQAKPMVAVYVWSKLMYRLVGRWLVTTPNFTLPNLIAGLRIVPELVPHFGGPEPMATLATELLDSPELAEKQRENLRGIVARFSGFSASAGCADIIERALLGEPLDTLSTAGTGATAPAAQRRTGTSPAATTE
jgi:lipid-A-disaccharide synthase